MEAEAECSVFPDLISNKEHKLYVGHQKRVKSSLQRRLTIHVSIWSGKHFSLNNMLASQSK